MMDFENRIDGKTNKQNHANESAKFVSRYRLLQHFVAVMFVLSGATIMNTANAGPLGGLLETKSPYSVTTSELVMANKVASIEPIYWLDNDRVIFPGVAAQKHVGPDGKEVLSGTPFGLYIWNIKQNTYTRYSDLSGGGMYSFYYDHGNISYSLSIDQEGNSVQMVGKFGEEKRINLPGGRAIIPELVPSEGPTGTFRHEPSGERSLMFSLLPEHGYILVATGPITKEITPTNQNDKVKLYRPGQPQPIELPILVKEMHWSTFSYSDYLGKYVVIPGLAKDHDIHDPNRYSRKDTDPIIFYLISPQGQVETIEIPAGHWYPHKVFPTRQGVFWVSNDTHGNSREAGGWLLHEGKVTKLFNQLVSGAGVSPDGCTIVHQSNDFNPKTNEFLQAIHLCDK